MNHPTPSLAFSTQVDILSSILKIETSATTTTSIDPASSFHEIKRWQVAGQHVEASLAAFDRAVDAGNAVLQGMHAAVHDMNVAKRALGSVGKVFDL